MPVPLAGLLPVAGSFGGGALARMLLSRLLPSLAKKPLVGLGADLLGGGAAYLGIEHLLGQGAVEPSQDNTDNLNDLATSEGHGVPMDNDLELIRMMAESDPQSMGLV